MEPMILGIPVGAFVVLSVVAPTWLVYLGFESQSCICGIGGRIGSWACPSWCLPCA